MMTEELGKSLQEWWVSAQKMETFTELFVRSIQGRGDCVSLQTNK
jgi:hypothetical protein